MKNVKRKQLLLFAYSPTDKSQTPRMINQLDEAKRLHTIIDEMRNKLGQDSIPTTPQLPICVDRGQTAADGIRNKLEEFQEPSNVVPLTPD